MKNEKRENTVKIELQIKLSEAACAHIFSDAAKEDPPPHIMSHADYLDYMAQKLV